MQLKRETCKNTVFSMPKCICRFTPKPISDLCTIPETTIPVSVLVTVLFKFLELKQYC